MTVIDFPLGFGLPMVNGKGDKKISATVLLNNISQPALPRCSSIELVSVQVRDTNGSTFGVMGAFLP